MLFSLFQVFLAYVFLSGKLANPDPLPPPKKIDQKNKFVLKCILGHFQCF